MFARLKMSSFLIMKPLLACKCIFKLSTCFLAQIIIHALVFTAHLYSSELVFPVELRISSYTTTRIFIFFSLNFALTPETT